MVGIHHGVAIVVESAPVWLPAVVDFTIQRRLVVEKQLPFPVGADDRVK